MQEIERIVIDGVEVPKVRGYALAQQRHNVENWMVAGLLDDYIDYRLERRVATSNRREVYLEHFFKWIQRVYSPRLVFYHNPYPQPFWKKLPYVYMSHRLGI